MGQTYAIIFNIATQAKTLTKMRTQKRSLGLVG
jgi:hypothetical protein